MLQVYAVIICYDSIYICCSYTLQLYVLSHHIYVVDICCEYMPYIRCGYMLQVYVVIICHDSTFIRRTYMLQVYVAFCCVYAASICYTYMFNLLRIYVQFYTYMLLWRSHICEIYIHYTCLNMEILDIYMVSEQNTYMC